MIAALLAALALAPAPPVQAAPASPGSEVAPIIQACLYADLSRDDWPVGLFALHRRFPGGASTRHIARVLTPAGEPLAPPQGPRIMLVHDVGENAPGALTQVSVSDVVIFDAGSPAVAEFEILVDGVFAERVPWPEYAAAAAGFRRGGAPRYIGTERWPVWGERGAALRARLRPEAKRLEVRLVDGEGRPFRWSGYDLAAQPLPTGELGVAVVRFVASDKPSCFAEGSPD